MISNQAFTKTKKYCIIQCIILAKDKEVNHVEEWFLRTEIPFNVYIRYIYKGCNVYNAPMRQYHRRIFYW